ncbi:MAG: hypothetical protein COU67_03625 [Candidatus Pacebacteria bacterium CG10_big_fil_rev_8_21_14_0_10_44_54]|uniref:PIN domain-containing protein n=1 Tax=Candidatus Lloydbacteria bacterium CG22_combo_CG10-13_8_21_14_all_47_15 TaxID=1974635 RepID=A0A2H0CUY2_9BACT|nr:MAG: hypothetical protein COW88_00965 [Candidatus Lloydbacteria bacterium CG22_combo_CG10-13_8_21_14_all_47_15]PIR60110.1 MAG: hypothetical protein COU67_03625 [Candidatus Pacebacteria bacterium CG10_big_fil_rev_8_21_14_0_10_44_54]
MKILLDTQIFIWLIQKDPRLGPQSKELVLSMTNEVYISFLSFFEMTIKSSLGKLDFDASVIGDLESMGVILLSGDQKSLSMYAVANSENKDPFDNFLISTAKVHKLTLLTSDHKILSTKAKGLKLLDATK